LVWVLLTQSSGGSGDKIKALLSHEIPLSVSCQFCANQLNKFKNKISLLDSQQKIKNLKVNMVKFVLPPLPREEVF